MAQGLQIHCQCRDTGSIPGLGRSTCYKEKRRARGSTAEGRVQRASTRRQEQPRWWGVRALQLERDPHSPQLGNPMCSNEDPVKQKKKTLSFSLVSGPWLSTRWVMGGIKAWVDSMWQTPMVLESTTPEWWVLAVPPVIKTYFMFSAGQNVICYLWRSFSSSLHLFLRQDWTLKAKIHGKEFGSVQFYNRPDHQTGSHFVNFELLFKRN